MRSFGSDNNSSVHPLVMEALVKANVDHTIGYGDDSFTTEAMNLMKEVFGDEAEVYFVFNGTGANTVGLQLMTRPYHSILCAETAHVYVDECGAPGRLTGCSMRPIATCDGKLTPELIRPHLHGFGFCHHSQPGAIYISQSTELGTIYSIEEIKAIVNLAHEFGLKVLMDGARLANAAVALNCSLKAMTADCGVDIVTFGGTKNGLMMGESVVVLNSSLNAEAPYVRKQTAQLYSKMRYAACQFTAYLTDDLWRKNAMQANAMAKRLAAAIEAIPGVMFTQKVESNALFVKLPRRVIESLQQDYFFYLWDEANDEARFVTSFDTTEADVDLFAAAIREAFEGI